MNDSYKSHSVTENEKAVRKVKRVTSGTRRKASTLQKLANVILADDIDSAKNYIWQNLVVPTIKRTLTSSFEALVYGSAAPRNTSYNYNGNRYYNYNQPQNQPQYQYSSRDVYDFGTITVPSAGEAQLVIDQLVDIINQYGAARVADFCEACDIPSEPTDNSYGWTDLRDARVIPTMNGFAIKLPKAIPIRN